MDARPEELARGRGSRHSPLIHGVDFTSAPTRRKPITIASGRLDGDRLEIDAFERCVDFPAFEHWLRRPGPWIAAFDFPFGLPRALVAALGWPLEADATQSAWQRVLGEVSSLPRARMIDRFRGYCDARPPGAKFAHRATDRPAGSSPSMKWVNPPVALMLHAGAPRLLAAGVDVPGLHAGDAGRVALEGYPGMLARELIGRISYKSDERARQNSERRDAREGIVDAIASGVGSLGLRAPLRDPSRSLCIDDATGDTLDAVLCAMQAAWAAQRRDAGYGLPEAVDPIEGWIVTAPQRERPMQGKL